MVVLTTNTQLEKACECGYFGHFRIFSWERYMAHLALHPECIGIVHEEPQLKMTRSNRKIVLKINPEQ